MRILLLATYELGRQPFGLASPAAWLRREGFDVATIDTSRAPVSDAEIAAASLVGIHLQMHTATRLAGPLLERVRRLNPLAHVCGYGLYAPLNEEWLRDQGVATILGGEFEEGLVDLARALASNGSLPSCPPHLPYPPGIPRLAFMQPDRTTLPALAAYASVQMPDGSRRTSGATEASRGCRHLCRHCPIVPVYQGQFRIVPADVVLADVRAQVAAGAGHISFGDPDFFNGPTHAVRVVEQLAREFPGVSYDATIKIEHLLRHAGLLPLLAATGCLFVTSAVESVDDAVLARLAKGHTRADFMRAVDLCRSSGLTLSPTFIPFTPWTSLEGYLDLIDTLDALDLVEHVAPIQLAIRLLVTNRSALLQLDDIRAAVDPFDASSLTWPWRHRDSRVDALQQQAIRTVGTHVHAPRADTFAALADLAASAAGRPRRAVGSRRAGVPVPCVNEPWYCCAEPDPELL